MGQSQQETNHPYCTKGAWAISSASQTERTVALGLEWKGLNSRDEITASQGPGTRPLPAMLSTFLVLTRKYVPTPYIRASRKAEDQPGSQQSSYQTLPPGFLFKKYHLGWRIDATGKMFVLQMQH